MEEWDTCLDADNVSLGDCVSGMFVCICGGGSIPSQSCPAIRKLNVLWNELETFIWRLIDNIHDKIDMPNKTSTLSRRVHPGVGSLLSAMVLPFQNCDPES